MFTLSQELIFESEELKFTKKIDFKIDKIMNNHIKIIYYKIKLKNIYSQKNEEIYFFNNSFTNYFLWHLFKLQI